MRKLATIRRIDDIQPIEGADTIECATIDGWKVVAQKGIYNVGDLAVYFEIDSWIPHDIAPFLSKGKEPREYNGVKGERLKTIRLRGQLSQGLLLPVHNDDTGAYLMVMDSEYGEYSVTVSEGDNVTDELKIIKWEAPIPACLAGKVRGNFPTAVPKSNQERCQNLKKDIAKWKDEGVLWELTEKCEGSSATYYLDDDGEFHVCSRNLDLERDENNTFWKMAIAYDLENKMKEQNLHGVAIQSELIGEGVQKNYYGIKGHDIRVYDIYDTFTGDYVDSDTRQQTAHDLGLKHVPMIAIDYQIDTDVDGLLQLAEGKSEINPSVEREGIVFKSMDGKHSFKSISNKFLLKTKN